MLMRIALTMGILGALALLIGCSTSEKDRYAKNEEPIPEEPTAERPKERPKELPRHQPAKQNPTEQETKKVTPDEQQPRDTTDKELAELVAYYRLDRVQVAIVSNETLDGLGDTLAQEFREASSRFGMRVMNAQGARASSTDVAAIRKLADQFNADLVVVVLGKAEQRDKFGNFYSYQATVRATVYEPNEGSEVATNELTKTGKRSTDQPAAEKSALLAAAQEIAAPMIEQIVRKVGKNVVSRRLTVRGVLDHETKDRILQHLRGRDGISDVRLVSWDQHSKTARWVVYLQPAAVPELGVYLAQTPELKIRIEAENRKTVEGSNNNKEEEK